MEAIFRLASQVSTPIGLAALAVAVFFGLFLTPLRLRIWPQLSKVHAYRLIRLIVSLVFALSALVVVLWFAGTVWSRSADLQALNLAGRTVEIEARNAPLQDILSNCAQQVGAALALDQRIQGRFTLRTSGTLRNVMDAICEAFDCRWEVDAGRPPVLFVRPKSGPSHERPVASPATERPAAAPR